MPSPRRLNSRLVHLLNSQVPGRSCGHAITRTRQFRYVGGGADQSKRRRAFPLAMAEGPATPARNEPVPSSDRDGKHVQRLCFPAFLVFLYSKASPTLAALQL